MNKLFGLFLLALAFLVPTNISLGTPVSLPSPIVWPGIVGPLSTGPSIANLVTLSSAGHYYAYVFVAREDMVISHIGVRYGTATGSPTITVGIETIDTTTGLPSGSAGFGSTNATTGTITSNTYVLTALGGSATISKGTVFAVKIALASGTSQIISMINAMNPALTSNLPYVVTNTGTPTKGIYPVNSGMIALGSSSTTFYQVPGTIPATTVTAAGAFNNSTAGAKRGMLFTLPMNCRIVGMRWYGAGTAGDYTVTVFDNAGNELSSSATAFDGDAWSGTGASTMTVYFDNPVTLTAGTPYRVAVEPTTTTNVNVGTLQFPSVNYRSASPAGTTASYTTFTTAGGWVDSATDTIPLMDIIIDQVDDGSGTGSGGRIIGG